MSIKRQPNKKCNKCKREIKQQYNEVTKCYEYAEVFKGITLKNSKTKYYCNDCYIKIDLK